jgi:hypothetical protein
MGSLWTWLSTPPGTNEVLDLFGALCLLLFAPGYLLSAYLAGPGASRLAKNSIQFAGIRYWATIGLWVFGAGLFFFGVRALQINPLAFGAPIWLIVCVLAVVFTATRCIDWWLTVYPAERGRRFVVETVQSPSDLGSRVSSPASRPTIPEPTVRR